MKQWSVRRKALTTRRRRPAPRDRPSTSTGGCELHGAPHETRPGRGGCGADGDTRRGARGKGEEQAPGSSSAAVIGKRPVRHSATPPASRQRRQRGAQRQASHPAGPRPPGQAALLGAVRLRSGECSHAPSTEGQRAMTRDPAAARRLQGIYQRTPRAGACRPPPLLGHLPWRPAGRLTSPAPGH